LRAGFNNGKGVFKCPDPKKFWCWLGKLAEHKRRKKKTKKLKKKTLQKGGKKEKSQGGNAKK